MALGYDIGAGLRSAGDYAMRALGAGAARPLRDLLALGLLRRQVEDLALSGLRRGYRLAAEEAPQIVRGLRGEPPPGRDIALATPNLRAEEVAGPPTSQIRRQARPQRAVRPREEEFAGPPAALVRAPRVRVSFGGRTYDYLSGDRAPLAPGAGTAFGQRYRPMAGGGTVSMLAGTDEQQAEAALVAKARDLIAANLERQLTDPYGIKASVEAKRAQVEAELATTAKVLRDEGARIDAETKDRVAKLRNSVEFQQMDPAQRQQALQELIETGEAEKTMARQWILSVTGRRVPSVEDLVPR